MKQNLFLLLALLITSSLLAQTNIPAGNVSGTWTKANSPYFINGDITVPDDSLLTIEAGVLVEFQDAYRLTVDGSIVANGKSGDSVYFLPKVKNTGWKGMLYLNNYDGDSGIFKYCVFKYVSEGYLQDQSNNPIKIKGNFILNAAFALYQAKNISISNCLFETNYASFNAYGSYLILNNSLFTKHDGSITQNNYIGYFDSCDTYISKCKFNNNLNTRSYPDHGINIGKDIGSKSSNTIVDCEFNNNLHTRLIIGSGSKALIESCVFKKDSSNYGGAFYIAGANGTIRNCLFDENATNNFGAAVCISRSSYGTTFDNCIFKNSTSGTGVQCYEAYSCPAFINCSFINNDNQGLSATEGSDNLRIVNCFFTKNVSGIYLESGSHSIVNCTIVNNKASYANTGGINLGNTSNTKIYNTILWGNRNINNDKVQVYINQNNNKTGFYNCIIEGDSGSFQKGPNNDRNWIGTYENCDSNYPKFTDTIKGDWTLLNSCSEISSAHNKGFKGFIRDPRFPTRDVLTFYSSLDLNGNQRIVGDSIDIGAYEIVNPKDRLIIDEQPKDSLVCLGNDALFSVQTTGSITNYTWEYSDNGTNWFNAGSNTSALVLNSPAFGLQNRQFRVKLSADCGKNLTSDIATLKVANKPTAFAGKDTLVCDAIPISLLASGGKTYAWSNGSTSNVLSFTPTQDTVFVVEVLDSNGCTDKDSISIKKSQRPMVNLGPDKTIDDWGKETLDAGTHTSYLWNDKSTLQTLEVDGHVQGLGKHLFWVEVENVDGCEARDSIYITVDDITHILEGKTFALNAYPNPTQNKLTFKLPQGFQNGIIHIYSLTGNLIKTIRVQGTNPIIDMAFLNAGTYLVQLYSKEKSYFAKVMKE